MSSSDKLKIPLQEISSATNEFAEANIIGKGGYGLVYRGQSEQHGMLAIKRLHSRYGQGVHEYGMEISLLSKYKHENLVSLIGFCGEAGEKILVYKYEANQSLDKFLHKKDFSWIRRLRICLGAARGLRYLHNETGSGYGVIHRDIKSSNILLDDNWNAKVSDFGLSKIALTNSAESVMFTIPCGTMGYVDPQILYGCGITQKSDVYSFGVVLFEVLFGRLVAVPGNLGDDRFTVNMAKKHYKEKTLDMMIIPELAKEMTSDSLSTFSTIAYRCLKKRVEDRPTMSLVVEALEKALGYHLRTGIISEGPDKDNPVISLSLINDHSQYSSSSLFSELGRKLSIYCLLHSSRFDHGLIASLNRSFRALVRSGELYKLRKLMGITEHWVYISHDINKWVAFDPIHCRWMRLPTMDCREFFRLGDKESLAVGSELLVFDRHTHEVCKYSILANSWSPGSRTNTPRCMFASASLGEIAIVAGGWNRSDNILSSAELYNSETETWVTLPNMNKPRKQCSGVFMESKFYVIGGIGEDDNALTCGEVYDLKAGTWTVIPNMCPTLKVGKVYHLVMGQDAHAPATTKFAVVKNELYAACSEEQELRKYDKRRNVWVRVCGLPKTAQSMGEWGLAFQACGDQLIYIGEFESEGSFSGKIELNSLVPDESQPQWNVLARKHWSCYIGIVYMCAVMGC